MRRTVLALLAAAASAALAPAPAEAQSTPAPPGWTGLYTGLALGARVADVGWDTTAVAPGFGVGGGTVPDPVTRGAALDSAAFRAGLFAGYNWQFAAQWVAGLEADAGWGRARRKLAGLPGAEGPAIGFTVGPGDAVSVKQKWDASLRGRLGFLVTPAMLVYGTAGVSFLRVDANAACAATLPSWCTIPNVRSETRGATRTGWTLGAGLEGMVAANWLVRVEYRYADYGTAGKTFFANTPDVFSADLSVRTHTVLVGLAYRWSAAY
jgi:outer membrane immunogenic protein